MDAARARAGDRTIRAPFAGVVGLSDIAPGALINPGAAIVTLDDVSAIRVDFDIPDRYLANIREGQQIIARVDAYPGETITGRIPKLDTRIDERTRAITARAEFPNPSRKLKPGMMLRGHLRRASARSWPRRNRPCPWLATPPSSTSSASRASTAWPSSGRW